MSNYLLDKAPVPFVKPMRMNQLSAPNGPLTMGNQRLSNVADPMNDSDATTKGFVDAKTKVFSLTILAVGDLPISTFRCNLIGCRFENAGGGTDLYITQTNGSIIVEAGTMQSDVLTGTSTGFANLSGGTFSISHTWLFGQGSRVFTQAFNVSGTCLARIDPVIGVGSVGITVITPPAYVGFPRRLDWVRLSNASTALQNYTAVANTPQYVTGSTLQLPNPLQVGFTTAAAFGTATRLEWDFMAAKSAAGTGNFNVVVYAGPNGTTADTAILTLSATSTAVADNAIFHITLTCTTAGASGVFAGLLGVMHRAATATGFGYTDAATGLAGNSTAFNLTTGGTKFGIALTTVTGTPVMSVSGVRARAINLD